jgi:hypothetical protein
MRTELHPSFRGLAILGALALAALPAHAISLFPDAAIHAILSGGGVVPAIVTPASGDCAGRITPSTGKLVLICSNDVAGAGSTFLTIGAPGTGGGTVLSLGSGAIAGGEATLSETQVALLLTGGLYVAVSSGAHPGGEIAARLIPAAPLGEEVMRFPLRNDEMVSTGSGATGLCALRVTAGHGAAHVVCVHDVASPGQFRLQIDGGVIATSNDTASPFELSLPPIAAQYGRLLEGDFGVVLTSGGFPGGELGKVLSGCIEGPTRLCLNRDRFEVSATFNAPTFGSGSAKTVRARAPDSGLFWFFAPTNWEVQLKVLDGCGLNNRFWIFMSANTNVQFTVNVYDTKTGATKSYSNPQGVTAKPVEDTSALPCT